VGERPGVLVSGVRAKCCREGKKGRSKGAGEKKAETQGDRGEE